MQNTDELVAVRWFTQMGGVTLGIVKVRTVTGVEKAYLGAGRGLDEKMDARIIMDEGAAFPIEAANLLGMTPFKI